MKQQELLKICRESILHLMDANKLHVSQLARELNVPQPTLYRLLKGKTYDIKLSTLLEIANFFSVTLSDLISIHSHSTQQINNSCHIAPILSWTEAALWPHRDNHDKRAYCTLSTSYSKQSFALRTKPSAAPIFKKNTLIIVDPANHINDGDYVIVKYPHTEEVALRIVIMDGESTELKKLTTHSTPQSLTKEIKIIGPVVEAIIKFKE